MYDTEYDFVPEFRSTNTPKLKVTVTPAHTVDVKMGPTASGVACFPPLAQVTQLHSDAVSFIILLQVDEENANDPWELSIWHSSTSLEWSESPGAQISINDSPTTLQEPNSSITNKYFHATVHASSPLKFTIKFRNSPDQSWRWVRDELGVDDGTVVITPENYRDPGTTNLSDVIADLNQDLKVRPGMSQTPDTELWTIEADIAPAQDEKSAYANIELGTPWGGPLRWFALLRSDNPNHSTGLVLAAVGNSFENALAAVMYHARDVVFATTSSSSNPSQQLHALSDGIKPEWMEEWYDGLGYCTWNALGQDLTDEKVCNAVDALAEHNVHISSLVIDDNWQDIDYHGESQYRHGWNAFEAQPKAFPNGLKDTVSRIRAKHSNIKHVAVWHALLGYWGGISPSGKLAQDYETVEVVRENSPKRDMDLEGSMIVISKKDVGRFYDDFYRFLSTCGIDGVKTDVQFMVDSWASAKQRRELTNTYLDAWMIAALKHFSLRAISCMSQAPQIIFHQQLPTNKPPLLVRNSDDFFPHIPASHPWHIWANAHNSLLAQHLNVLPDWDMFQTAHEYSGFHAAARCLSGGPIYITDTPGQYNLNIINQITGETPRGNTVIFRPSVVGKSIDHYTDYHDDVLLKIGSYHGRAATGTPLLGVFNVSQKPLRELIPLSRLPGVLPSMSYVIRSHNTGAVTPVMRPGSHNAYLPVILEVRGYDILAAFPLTQFNSEARGRVYAANLGLVGKMTGAAAITANGFSLLRAGRAFLDTRLKALGVLGVYISCLAELSIERHFMVTIQGQPIPPHTVTKSGADVHVLEVDVETAWKDMGLKAGWSNEVEVKVYFNIEKGEESF
ncbi:hypothetical protein DL770_004108 [Monosporascus sp. CRB-9-2]|nr:hypothetical protein DL770_004108 [Monosporascus sp. CRB-9-2]